MKCFGVRYKRRNKLQELYLHGYCSNYWSADHFKSTATICHAKKLLKIAQSAFQVELLDLCKLTKQYAEKCTNFFTKSEFQRQVLRLMNVDSLVTINGRVLKSMT